MDKLPNWMQWIVYFCAITGLAFWFLQLESLMDWYLWGGEMTRDDIIRMAREVGFVAYGEDAGQYRIPTPAFHCRLERFAALVAAAEREREHQWMSEVLGAFPISKETLEFIRGAIRARGNQ